MKKEQFIPAILVAACLGCASGAALAATPGSTDLQIQSETVHYNAADIRGTKSAKDLFFRIRKAAEDVCSDSSEPRGYEMWLEHDCETAAVAKAVRQANLPALSDYYVNDLHMPAPN